MIDSNTLDVDIKLDKANSSYQLNDYVSGTVTVFSKISDKLGRIDCFGVQLQAEGSLTLQNKQTNVSLDKVANDLKTPSLFLFEANLNQENMITQEKSTFPFKFKLVPKDGETLLQTYVGVYISIGYEIDVEIKLANNQSLQTNTPFFVYIPGFGKDYLTKQITYPRSCPIVVDPKKLVNNANQKVPNFKVSGFLDSDICYIQDEISGFFQIEECEGQIRTIDLQLIRVEQIQTQNGKFSEATEIQLIQAADGNLTRKIDIPIYMIFPKYFSCPNFQYKDVYQVDFEINFILILFDGFKITLNFPLRLIRN